MGGRCAALLLLAARCAAEPPVNASCALASWDPAQSSSSCIVSACAPLQWLSICPRLQWLRRVTPCRMSICPRLQ